MIDNVKVAATISAATFGVGLSTILNAIPDDIGKIATLVGIVLSVCLIYVHIRNGKIEYKKAQLEIRLLEQKLERRKND